MIRRQALMLVVALIAGVPGPQVPARAQAPGAVSALLDPLTVSRQQGRYAPRDDCAGLAGAADFSARLARAVAANDAGAVAAMASEDVVLGFAGDDGRARFLAQLREGALMRELALLLPLGCAVNAEGELTMPWYFAQDMGDIDGYDTVIVMGEGVPLHAAADPSSPVLMRVSWDAVTLVSGFEPQQPVHRVAVHGGEQGFIATERLRSLLDYRMVVSRVKGEWAITAIVAGD